MKCPKCGFKNPQGAKFCNQCGAQLHAIKRRRDIGQRRRVAVLFADISGFTPLSETLDPEELRDLIDACLQRLAGVIYKYEGYIDKFIGDCIMALFGAPIAHEDDPLRAVISALELQKEIKKFNKEKNLDFSLSIGINYGLVATGDLGRPGEYTVMGDVVNLAQRLQYAAPKGRIYTNESVYKHTSEEIVYNKLKKIKVKGKKVSILVYEPQGIKRKYSLRRIKEMPLIGRGQELGTLLELYSMTASGKGQVASIIGEAGIGKSKLTYEFKKQLSKDNFIVEGRGIQYLSSASYLVLQDTLRDLIGIEESGKKTSAAQLVENFIKATHYSSLNKIVPFIKYFLGLPLNKIDHSRFNSMQPKDRIRMINEALCTLFIRISNIKPLVIVFEDCHWIDQETIDFMERFVKNIGDSKVMIVNLYRPEFNVDKKTSSLSFFTQFNLKPLKQDDTLILLYDLLRCKDIEDKLVKLLMRKSGRVPFYIHELANNLLNNDIIFKDNGIARLRPGKESAVPRTLDELVMAKVDKLGSRQRAIVDIASVIGDEFSIRLLDTLLEFGKQLKKDLQELIQKGIIFAQVTAKRVSAQEEKYTFAHSLMKEAVYQSLLRQTRKEYHRQIGYAIEQVYADDLSEFLDALANHFLIADEKNKSVEYLEKAADRKKELFVNEEAIELYQKAIKLIDSDNYRKISDIHEKLGQIYELIGQYDKAKDAYTIMGEKGKKDILTRVRSFIAMTKVYIGQGSFDQAIDMLNKAGRTLKTMKKINIDVTIEKANILRLECWVYRIKGKMDIAKKKGLEAISMIKNIKSKKEWRTNKELKHTLLVSHAPLAIAYSFLGEYDKAVHLLEEALIIAEDLGEQRALGDAYNNLGTIYRTQSKFDQAIDAFSMKLKISQELGDKSGIGIAYCNMGNVYENKGEYEKSIELLKKYLRINEELGSKHGIGIAHCNLAVAYQHSCAYEKAEKELEEALRFSEEIGDNRMITFAVEALGEVYVSKLEYKKAVEQFIKTLEISKKSGDKWTIGSSSHQLGAAYIKTGKIDQAEKLLNIAKDIFEDIGNKRVLSAIYNSISILRTKQKRLGDALDAAKKAHAIAKEIGITETSVATLISLGLIYSMEGKHQSLKKARDAFEKALTIAMRHGNKKLLADCYFKYGRAFWSSANKQDKSRARKNITEALKFYKEIDLKARVQEITKLLRKH